DAFGNGEIERLPRRQGDPFLRPIRRLEEIDLQPVMDVRTLHSESAPAPGAALTAPTEEVGEDVRDVPEILEARMGSIAPPAAGAGVFAVETLLRTLGAGCVDLALVEARALLGIAEDVVGGGHR